MKFTDEQLVILDQIKPFLDFEYEDTRKGHAQSYPVMHIMSSDTYWCDKEEALLPPPANLIGSFILPMKHDEQYTEWSDVRDSDHWELAEHKSVCEMKWVVKGTKSKLEQYERFVKGIKPYLLAEGYTGFVENIDELLAGDTHHG